MIHLHAGEHVAHKPFRSFLRYIWGSHQLSGLEYGKISSPPIRKILHNEELILLPCFSQDFGKLLLNFSDAPLNAALQRALQLEMVSLLVRDGEWGFWKQ